MPACVRCPSFLGLVALLLIQPVGAQEAPGDPPPPAWEGDIGAGLALTSGNTDTSNFNVSFELSRNPEARNVLSAKGLYLRGSTEGHTTVDRTTLALRDEYGLSERTFFYGQLDYLRDQFKQIDYLVAPTAGVGYKVYETEVVLLSTDGGVGFVWEKNPGRAVQASGALTAAEHVEISLSDTATLTHLTTALWKMDDFVDGLYTFGAGLATSITGRAQLTLEVIDTFKNRPPTPDVQKNDLALVTAITWSF